MISFTVPGDPVGKGRPRATSRGGFVRMYTPEKTAAYERKVALIAAGAMVGKPLFAGPVVATITAVYPIPSSWPKKKRERAVVGDIWPTVKPDLDNVEKVLFDAMNGIVWNDDKQAVVVTKYKAYGVEPRVEIEVSEIER